MKKIMTQKEATAFKQAATTARSARYIVKSSFYSDSDREKAQARLDALKAEMKALTASADAVLDSVQARCTAGLFTDAVEILTKAADAAESWTAFFPSSVLAGSVIEIAARRVDCNAYRKKGTPMTTKARLEIQKNGALLIKEIWRGDATYKNRFEPSPACAEWISNSKHYL